MLFIVKFETSAATRDASVERFKKTGALPPAGIKMLGRWHNADGTGGLCIAETDDASAIAAWVHQWTDILVFDVRPALTDEQLAKVLMA